MMRSENVHFEDVQFKGKYSFQYIDNAAFEKSQVKATVTSSIVSIKNPLSGQIQVPEVGELIMDDENAKGEVIICGWDNCNMTKECNCA